MAVAQLAQLEPPLSIEIEQDVLGQSHSVVGIAQSVLLAPGTLMAVLDVVLTDCSEEGNDAAGTVLTACRALLLSIMAVRKDVGCMLILTDTLRPYLDSPLPGKLKVPASERVVSP